MRFDAVERLNDLKQVYGTYKALSKSLGISTSTLRRYRSGASIPPPIRKKISRRFAYFKDDDFFLYQWVADVTDKATGQNSKVYSNAFAFDEKDYWLEQFKLSLSQSQSIKNPRRFWLIRRKITDNGKTRVRQLRLR